MDKVVISRGKCKFACPCGVSGPPACLSGRQLPEKTCPACPVRKNDCIRVGRYSLPRFIGDRTGVSSVDKKILQKSRARYPKKNAFFELEHNYNNF